MITSIDTNVIADAYSLGWTRGEGNDYLSLLITSTDTNVNADAYSLGWTRGEGNDYLSLLIIHDISITPFH